MYGKRDSSLKLETKGSEAYAEGRNKSGSTKLLKNYTDSHIIQNMYHSYITKLGGRDRRKRHLA